MISGMSIETGFNWINIVPLLLGGDYTVCRFDLVELTIKYTPAQYLKVHIVCGLSCDIFIEKENH